MQNNHFSKRVFLFFVLCTGSVHAQLVWEQKLVELRAQPGDEQVEATYHFRNAGSFPVKITKLTSSCGCTTPQLTKDTYAPGESGEVLVTFKIGSRIGLQKKTIEVRTEPPVADPVVLGIYTDIKENVELDRRIVFWSRGEKPVAREIHIKVLQADPVRIVRAEASDSRLRVELQAVEAGREYLVRLTPADTASPLRGDVTLHADTPANAPQTFTIKARVK